MDSSRLFNPNCINDGKSFNETAKLPSVSIIIPCRNEEKFIGICLESILANDYPKERLEVLVVDGMSEDGTRAILNEYTRQYPFIKVVNNRKRITPVAFNIGIKHARGDLIMIMSAHATFAADAIGKFAEYSSRYNADNVGGICKIYPRNNNFIANTIVHALSHKFGVGGALYRTGGSKQPRWVDTAAYGCYKREVFEKIGVFNEKLLHSQDMEFNLRLKNTGGKTLLVPDIVINYYARSDFASFCRHNFRNGLWVILPFLYSDIMPVSWRHLVPLAFVLGLIGSAALALLWPIGLWLLMGIAGAYGTTNLAASAHVAIREGDIRYLLVMPVVFASLHLGYGMGSLWGLVKVPAHTVSSLCKRSRSKSPC